MAPNASNETAAYRVVARRFRPTTFGEIVGQDAVLRTLRSALASGRIPHAFLFSGSRGVGKTTTARILARALNCEGGPTPDPCGRCGPCMSIADGSNPDVVEIDAASHNLVEDVRELRERVGVVSMGSRYKVYILDEVHMLTRSAFNAFLKTLEEPPAKVVFVLATTELHKVPETIRSRCQVHLFRRIDETDMVQRLREICAHDGVEADDAVLEELAAGVRGGMRDAETALERLLPVAHENGGRLDVDTWRRLAHRVGTDAVIDTVQALCAGDAARALRFAAEAAASGVDEREALGEILEVVRALLLLSVDGEDSALVTWAGGTRQRLAELARGVERHRLEAIVQAGLLARERIRRLEDRRLVLELALLRMAEAGSLPELGAVVEALRGAAGPAAEPPSGAAAGGAGAGGGSSLRAGLLARLKKEQPLLVRTIEECELSEQDDGVVVELRSGRKMHRDRLAAEGVQRQLRSLLGELAGREVNVEFRLGGAGTGAPAAPARSGGEKPAAPGAAARKVAERFDGQILDDQTPSPQ